VNDTGQRVTDPIDPADLPETDIAIVGMAGHFPGAPDADTLWARVVKGDDCLVDLDAEQLRRDGVPDHVLVAPNYVRRNGVLDGVDLFDPGFFGISKRDAAIMDPQHRHFIECTWEALESAGYTPESFVGSIGLFAGCGVNTYLLNNLLTNPKLVEQVGWFLLRHTGNDKDFLTTTASYRLDLRGPSVNVQTACSTSLVAIHLAVQSLLAFECDLALAGGSTIEFPHGLGYVYHEGEVLSPDGVCRAFDARSGGTVLTSGAGVVALRRLRDAYEAGDPILAVVKGSAINNDGTRKVGYLAPSVDGHADVIREALAVSGVDARSIQLFEAHGTGTAVGDPIEVAAVTEAYRTHTADCGYCRLVSTKPNIGHLDTAAGVASVIKVVQALRHKVLPPMANHTSPSPLIDLPSTPFVMSAEAAPWHADGPRRAGVSSLGVGGTNAHVILEEAPAYAPTPPARPEQVLAISGRDAQAVKDASERLAKFLEADPDVNLADVAYTTFTGRRPMTHRRVVSATDVASAITQLRTDDRGRSFRAVAQATPPNVVFLFPGGGAQYPRMAQGLDERFDEFHRVMRDGCAIVHRETGVDLAALLAGDGDDDAELRRPTASLPAVFLTSLALARQWMAWGVTPTACIGHSLGEYVAAHLAGVLSFDDALRLVMVRSRLIESVSGDDAAMMVVPMTAEQVQPLLPAALSIATINAADECTVAGPRQAIEELHERLTADGVTATLIPIAAAGHSAMLDPILPAFLDTVRTVRLQAPTMRYVSNLTGDWIRPDQATDPQYWVDHLRHTVRFHDALATALHDGPAVFVELGPGHSLSSYARRLGDGVVAAVPTLRHPNQAMDDTGFSLCAFARLWAVGVDVEPARFSGEGRRRLRLPTYPFQRERCWIEPGAASALSTLDASPVSMGELSTHTHPSAVELERISRLDDMFWVPAWLPAARTAQARPAVGGWVVAGDDGDPLVAAIADQLRSRGLDVAAVGGPDVVASGDGRGVVLIGTARDTFDDAAARWLHDAPAALRHLAEAGAPTRFVAVTRGATGPATGAARPTEALAFGAVLVAPGELPDLDTTLVDLDASATAEQAAAVVDEVLLERDRVVALRGDERFVPITTPMSLAAASDAPTFRHGGTYLVTGALGGVGHVMAHHLATVHAANLVVFSSEAVPTGEDATAWVARHGYDDPTSRRIRRLAELEAAGTKVLTLAVDMADPHAVREGLAEATRRVGSIDGAIHAAGRLNDQLIELATDDDHEIVVGAKARGALVLADELERLGAELLVLVSSTSTLLAPQGQLSYVAANAVLDAMAGRAGPMRVVTFNSGVWAGTGIAAAAATRVRLGIDAGEPVLHPILEEMSVDRSGATALVGHLDAAHHWVVDEHRTETGVALLPGTGQLDLFLAAARLAGTGPIELRTVNLLEPLVVPDGKVVTVRVTVDPPGTAERMARIESDGGDGRGWYLHSEAALVPAPSTDAPTIDLAEAVGSCPLDGFDPMERPRRHLRLGAHWNRHGEARLGDAIAVTSLRHELAAGIPELAAWDADPALVDIATGLGVMLSLQRDDAALHVPVTYERVAWYSPIPREAMVRAVRHPASTPDLLRVDLDITDADGVVAMSIDGLHLRPILEASALGTAEPAPPSSPGRVPPLIALAEGMGITADEGPELFERVLAHGHPRVIASTVDIDVLRASTSEPEVEPAAGSASPSTTSVGGATVDAVLTTIWSELLGVAEIGPDDDFFDLGGHSLIAIRLMSRIQRELGVRFQLATIFEAPTVSALAALVRAERPDIDAVLGAAASDAGGATDVGAAPLVLGAATTAVAKKSLVTISTKGDGEPLFIVHGAGGNVLFLWSLARAMAGDRPIYGFQAHGIDGTDLPDKTVEEMAARYIGELRAMRSGPYLLGGYSGGGVVALEMVRQLQELGETVRYVLLFDSVPGGKATPDVRSQARNLIHHARHDGLAAIKPYLKYLVVSALRRYVPERPERSEEIAGEERALGYTEVSAHGFVNLFHYFSAAAEKYQTGRYRVDIGVLQADNVWPKQPADYYWTPHIDGRIDTRHVPGDHHSMFFPENAPRLADVVRELLADVDQR
jgi:acyl transferase domain-containing protein/surfactin synthase thioesterase subunit/acyl carrier protein